MTPLLPFLADIGVDEIAQLLIFVVLAIGAAIQQALKKRAAERRREEAAGRQESRHERGPPHQAPPYTPPHRRPPPPAPAPASAVRGSIPVAPPPMPTTHGGRIHMLADPKKRARALTGRRLLFAKNPTPHDRVRAAVLWHEVLGAPPGLGS